MHIEVALGQIGQHLGLPPPSDEDRTFCTPETREFYRPPPLREGTRPDSLGSPLPLGSATPLPNQNNNSPNQSNNAQGPRLTLEPAVKVLFTERHTRTVTNEPTAPVGGANLQAAPIPDMDFLEQIKQLIRTEIGGPSASLTYRSPYPDYVAVAEWPKGYKPIKFTTFSGEGSEDAATHISRFQGEYGPYGGDDNLKLRAFGSSLSGSALTWYTKLAPRSVPDWATMEAMFRTTFGVVEPEVDLSSLTSMYQQPAESSVEFLKRFKIQQAKCKSPIIEADAIAIGVKGLEHRQQTKHHDMRFASMADLMIKVGSYQLLLNELDDEANASKGTYAPGRHRNVNAIYAPVDPFYSHPRTLFQEDETDGEDIAALELTGRSVVKAKSLKIAREPVKISTMAFTKPEFETYTYNASKAGEILDELISQNLIKTDFGPYPKAEQLKGKKYCKFHNMWNHNTSDCISKG
ncbi:hypothetical protein M0R45_007047 [Rubus argutus]|uniref:Retrotransposon gag domain-containing protein n=1 Tax=Rubus argutus TaxID=59490 RepID=A0AAW1YSH5_RUBAR